MYIPSNFFGTAWVRYIYGARPSDYSIYLISFINQDTDFLSLIKINISIIEIIDSPEYFMASLIDKDNKHEAKAEIINTADKNIFLVSASALFNARDEEAKQLKPTPITYRYAIFSRFSLGLFKMNK